MSYYYPYHYISCFIIHHIYCYSTDQKIIGGDIRISYIIYSHSSYFISRQLTKWFIIIIIDLRHSPYRQRNSCVLTPPDINQFEVFLFDNNSNNNKLTHHKVPLICIYSINISCHNKSIFRFHFIFTEINNNNNHKFINLNFLSSFWVENPESGMSLRFRILNFIFLLF